jgi:prophage regulatory protein
MSKDSKIPELQNLPETGLLRIKQVLKFIPVSRSSWWAGVKSGRYPAARKLSARVTVWSVESIKALIDGSNGHDEEGAR